MRHLAQCALIGATISLSLTVTALSMLSYVVWAVLIWFLAPGFVLASVVIRQPHGGAQAFGVITIANAIFYWIVALFVLRTRRDSRVGQVSIAKGKS